MSRDGYMIIGCLVASLVCEAIAIYVFEVGFGGMLFATAGGQLILIAFGGCLMLQERLRAQQPPPPTPPSEFTTALERLRESRRTTPKKDKGYDASLPERELDRRKEEL